MKRVLIILIGLILSMTFRAGTIEPDSLSQLLCDTPENLTGAINVHDGGTVIQGIATAWDGSGFGITWVDSSSGSNKLYFARAATDGNLLTQPVIVSPSAYYAEYPSIVWTGTEYAIAWDDLRNSNYDIYLASISLSGDITEYRITTDSSSQKNPSLVWTGSEFGIAWRDSRNGNLDIYFAIVSLSGTVTEYQVTTDSYTQSGASLAWNGAEFGVAWGDSRNDTGDIYFATISTTGTVSEYRITTDSNQQSYPSIAWTGTEYGIAWLDVRTGNGDIYMGRVSTTGTVIGEYQETTGTHTEIYPSLAWTGAEYGLAWTDSGGGTYDLYFGRIDASGSRTGSDVLIYSMGQSAQAYNRYLTFGDKGFGLAWNLKTPKSLRFTYLGCHEDSTEPTCPSSPGEIGRTTGTVTLGWGPSRDNESGVSRYELYKDGSYLGTTGDLSYTDNAFDPAAGSIYWIDAINAVGLYSTGCSSVNTADSTAPTCVENLLASGVTQTNATLNWLPSQDTLSGLYQYIIYRNDSPVDTVPAGTETFTDTTMTGGNTYNFAVRAEDYAGNQSAICSTSRVWVSTDPITLTLTKDTDGVNADLDWNDINLNEYVVYRSTSPQTASEHNRVSISEDKDPVLKDSVQIYYYYIQQRGM